MYKINLSSFLFGNCMHFQRRLRKGSRRCQLFVTLKNPCHPRRVNSFLCAWNIKSPGKWCANSRMPLSPCISVIMLCTWSDCRKCRWACSGTSPCADGNCLSEMTLQLIILYNWNSQIRTLNDMLIDWHLDLDFEV